MIRVIVAEDHAAVRRGVVDYLEAQDGIAVVGEAENGREAVDLAHALDPDVLLIDVRMPVLGGIEATRSLKRDRPDARVILISAYEQEELIASGIEAGADAFLLKGTLGPDLVEEIRGVAA